LISFRDLMHPAITLEGFKALRSQGQAKRICFGSTHNKALKRNDSGEWAGSLFLPFNETMARIFPWTLYPKMGGHGRYYHLGIKEEKLFDEVKAWTEKHSDLVFIRSLFDTAMATCEHYNANNTLSKIGSLEKAAKYSNDHAAKAKLVAILGSAFDRLHIGLGITAVASVPSSNQNQPSLPNHLAAALSQAKGLPDLTSSLRWDGPKGQIKELGVDEKWAALEKVGLSVDAAVAGRNLLLIDDMYQSGATAHFVASRLRAVGANDLHLLAVSKGKRDTDNK
jgi:hypothetical protein